MGQDKVLTKMYSYIVGYLKGNNKRLGISKDKKKDLLNIAMINNIMLFIYLKK
jgi:hypothetical protein